jgi:hypothetical protein
MSTTITASTQTERIAYGRLWWVSLLAIAASVVANTINERP